MYRFKNGDVLPSDFIDKYKGNYEFIPERPGEARETLSDTNKAKKILGWEPKDRLKQYVNSL